MPQARSVGRSQTVPERVHTKNTHLHPRPRGVEKIKPHQRPRGIKLIHQRPQRGLKKSISAAGGSRTVTSHQGPRGSKQSHPSAPVSPPPRSYMHRCFIHCIADTIARAAEAGLAIRGRAAPWQRMADCRRSGGIVRTSLPKCDGCRNDSAAVMHARPACGPRRAESCGCQKVARKQRRSSCCGPCPVIACTGTTSPRNSKPPPTAHRRRSACD